LQSHAARFFLSLYFDLANGLGDPLGRARLEDLEKYLDRRLREHGLGVQSIAFSKLG
jgi:hypothetical protein